MIYFRQRGFTIIELMITLMLASIVVLMAVPSFARTINNNRVTTAVNDFNTSLAFAKSEAVKHNRSVKLVSNSDDWVQGYSIGIDLNGDNDFTDSGETSLKIVEVAATNVTIDPVPNTLSVIEINNLGGMTDTGSIVFDSRSYACKRTINLNASGVYTLSKEREPCS